MTANPAGIGPQLISFAQAVVHAGADASNIARDQLVMHLSVEAMIDAAGVASNFQRMARISDATGIVLGDYEASTADLRENLGINRLARK